MLLQLHVTWHVNMSNDASSWQTRLSVGNVHNFFIKTAASDVLQVRLAEWMTGLTTRCGPTHYVASGASDVTEGEGGSRVSVTRCHRALAGVAWRADRPPEPRPVRLLGISFRRPAIITGQMSTKHLENCVLKTLHSWLNKQVWRGRIVAIDLADVINVICSEKWHCNVIPIVIVRTISRRKECCDFSSEYLWLLSINVSMTF